MTLEKKTLSLKGEFFVSIYYEDTDFTGYVYHANYLKFFERAREELIGFNFLKQLYAEEKHFVIKDLTMNFKKPAHHSDRLKIKTFAEISSSPRALFRQEAWLIRKEDKKEALLVSADLKLVFVGSLGKPIRIDLKQWSHLTA